MSFDEDEVRRRLAAAVSGLPFDPPDAAPLRAEGRRRRRNRRIGSAAGVALSVAVVAGVIAVGPGQSSSPKPAPVLNRPTAPVTPSVAPRPATASSSAPAPAVATSTVDPTAPVRVAYVNDTGVWIATLDPATAHEIGRPLHVSDTVTPDYSVSELEFSPQGRYLVWQESPNITPAGKSVRFGLFDGETGKHFTVTEGPAATGGVNATGSVTATGTGAYIVFGSQARTVDHNGVVAAAPTVLTQDASAVVGTYPGGFLVSSASLDLLRVPADGGAPVASHSAEQGGQNMATGNAEGTSVYTYSGGQACRTISSWTVTRPDGTTSDVVFTKHPGRDTLSLTVSPDGVVGGVVTDCNGTGPGPSSFVELDGVIAHTTATNVTAAARGPHDILGEVRGTYDEGSGDHHLRIYNASNQLTADLGGPVDSLVFAPEHLP